MKLSSISTVLAVSLPAVLGANFGLLAGNQTLEYHSITRNGNTYYVAQVVDVPEDGAPKIWSVSDEGEFTVDTDKDGTLPADFSSEGGESGGIITFTAGNKEPATGFEEIKDYLYYQKQSSWYLCSHGNFAGKLAIFTDPAKVTDNCKLVTLTVAGSDQTI